MCKRPLVNNINLLIYVGVHDSSNGVKKNKC